MYEDVFPQLIREQFPDMTEEQVLERRDHMIAKPVTDLRLPSPHATGAAVDLKLRYQQNTRIFYNLMRGALTGKDSGFAVNPTEWWHWSYGDQLWAVLINTAVAFYGMAQG